MRIKNADVAAGLIAVHPVMHVAWNVVEKYLGDTMVTDTFRKVNGKSLHRFGLALDFRTKDKYTESSLREETILSHVIGIKRDLPGFDVVLEKYGKEDEHLHIEFDPRVDG